MPFQTDLPLSVLQISYVAFLCKLEQCALLGELIPAGTDLDEMARPLEEEKGSPNSKEKAT